MADFVVQEANDSIRRGSSRQWEVRAKYEVAHGVLRAVGGVRHDYSPLAYPEIVGEIAKLHEGDERRLLAFARRWGLLGYPPQLGQGDPLPWIWAHARGIRMVLELQFYLQEGDFCGLGQFLDSYPRPDAGPLAPEETILLSTGGPSGIVEQRVFWVVTTPSHTAREVIAAIINPNLRELEYQVGSTTEGEGLHRVLDFLSLMFAAYWHLAEVVTGSRALVRCQECRALFAQTDKRQRFCPPPPNWMGRRDSPCASRFRKRRERQRKAD